MKKASLVLLVVLSLLAASFAPIFAQDALIESVCLVTDIGKVNDGTFNQYAFEGMNLAAADFGLETTYIETTSQTDYALNIQTCLDSGFDAIITVGFLMTDQTIIAAEENPDVFFLGVDQGLTDVSENLVGLVFREDQAGFLAGAMAALVSENGNIAGVYGIPVPAVVKFRNGFEQGARYINPDIVVNGVYIDSFTDPARGAETASQLIAEGADVIFGAGGQTGSGAVSAGAAAGVYVIGVDQDEYYTTFEGGSVQGAEFLITSATKRVDQSVYLSLQALVEGDLEAFAGGGSRVFSADNDGVGFAPANDSDVSEEVTAQVEEILEGLKDGSIETGVDPETGELLDAEAEATEEAEAEGES